MSRLFEQLTRGSELWGACLILSCLVPLAGCEKQEEIKPLEDGFGIEKLTFSTAKDGDINKEKSFKQGEEIWARYSVKKAKPDSKSGEVIVEADLVITGQDGASYCMERAVTKSQFVAKDFHPRPFRQSFRIPLSPFAPPGRYKATINLRSPITGTATLEDEITLTGKTFATPAEISLVDAVFPERQNIKRAEYMEGDRVEILLGVGPATWEAKDIYFHPNLMISAALVDPREGKSTKASIRPYLDWWSFKPPVVPYLANLTVPLDIKPGAYSLQVEMKDSSTGKSSKMEKAFTVIEPVFSVAFVGFFDDEDGKKPSAMPLSRGEDHWLLWRTYGLKKEEGTGNAWVQYDLQLYDPEGKRLIKEGDFNAIRKNYGKKKVPRYETLEIALSVRWEWNPGRYELILTGRDMLNKVSGSNTLYFEVANNEPGKEDEAEEAEAEGK